MYEVEIKFRVNNVADFRYRLNDFGCAVFGQIVEEIDVFFQHPCRDFTQSDECLRLRHRRFPNGQFFHFLTYKGPKIDTQTKTRKEIEMPIDEAAICEELLEAVGFVKSAEIRKFRCRTECTVDGLPVEITLDTLPDLSEEEQTFAELETITAENDWERGKAVLLQLAEELDLTQPVRDSYLHLVQTAKACRQRAEH